MALIASAISVKSKGLYPTVMDSESTNHQSGLLTENLNVLEEKGTRVFLILLHSFVVSHQNSFTQAFVEA